MKTTSKHRKPPGPKKVHLFRALRKLQQDPIIAFEEDIQKHGSVVHYAFPLRSFTLITDPDQVHQILNSNAENYNKDTYSYRQLKEFIGNGLFTANGLQWSKYRRILHRSLSAENIKQTKPVIEDVIKKWMNERASNFSQNIDAGLEMTTLALMIMCRALLGFSLSNPEKIAKAVENVLSQTNHRITYPLHPNHWLPVAVKRDYQTSLQVLNNIVSEIIDGYVQDKLDESPIFKHLYDSESSGEFHTEEEIRDQIMTLFLAGHETTANVLTWFFYLVAQHPELQEKIRKEAGKKSKTKPYSDKKGHSLTASTIMETMRLYPPVWLFERKALREDRIANYRIPAGSTVAIFCYYMHRHPNLWDRPDQFIPDRFSGSHSTKYPRYAYFPFGGGTRHCIGNHFAMLELQLVIEILQKNYRFSDVTPSPVSPCAGLTLKPCSPVYLKMERL